MYRLNSWFRNSVQMNMLKRNINFEWDRKFFVIFLKIACRFFFLYLLFISNWNWLYANAIDDVQLTSFFLWVCRRWHLLVSDGLFPFLFLAKNFLAQQKKMMHGFFLLSLLFDFMWIEVGAVSFPTSTSIWVKVHQDLMKSASTAY